MRKVPSILSTSCGRRATTCRFGACTVFSSLSLFFLGKGGFASNPQTPPTKLTRLGLTICTSSGSFRPLNVPLKKPWHRDPTGSSALSLLAPLSRCNHTNAGPFHHKLCLFKPTIGNSCLIWMNNCSFHLKWQLHVCDQML